MPTRCSSTEIIELDGEDLTLQCVEWSEDPEGRHGGDHSAHVSPALGHVRKWPNENPL